MAGILTAAQFAALAPDSTLTGSVLASYLAAAQAIAEQLSGLVFGTDITAVDAANAPTYRLTVGCPVGEVGDSVRLIGGGASSDPFEITDAGIGWIEVSSAAEITSSTSKALPIVEHVGSPESGFVYGSVKPLWSVVSVDVRYSQETLWSDTNNIETLDTTQYETFTSRVGIKRGVRIVPSAIPLAYESGPYLVKRRAVVEFDCVRLKYVAGFYTQVPMDLQMAAVQVVCSLAEAIENDGDFSSESIDYYSYSNPSYEQMAALPQSAVSIFKRYADL